MKRREFMQTMGLVAGGLFLGPFLPKNQAWADAKTPMVDPKEATAKAVGYIEDGKKAPKAAGNKCATCSFYKKADSRNGKEVGTCMIFAGKYVYSDAYCNSWAKKS